MQNLIVIIIFKFQLQDTRVVGPFLPSPAKPLPSELDQFMQEAGDEGVILVSFGTVVGELDEKLLQMMAKAFSNLPQTIIWKLQGMLTKTGCSKMIIKKRLLVDLSKPVKITGAFLVLRLSNTSFTAYLWHSIF